MNQVSNLAQQNSNGKHPQLFNLFVIFKAFRLKKPRRWECCLKGDHLFRAILHSLSPNSRTGMMSMTSYGQRLFCQQENTFLKFFLLVDFQAAAQQNRSILRISCPATTYPETRMVFIKQRYKTPPVFAIKRNFKIFVRCTTSSSIEGC